MKLTKFSELFTVPKMEAIKSNTPEIDGNDGSNNMPPLKKTNPVS